MEVSIDIVLRIVLKNMNIREWDEKLQTSPGGGARKHRLVNDSLERHLSSLLAFEGAGMCCCDSMILSQALLFPKHGKYSFIKSLSLTEIMAELYITQGCLLLHLKLYKHGRMSTQNAERSGRTKILQTERVTWKVFKSIMNDRRLTLKHALLAY